MWETGFKNPPKRTASALAPVRCPRHTDFFRSISTYSIVIDADLYCKYVNLQMCTKCTHKSYIKKTKNKFFYNVLGVCILSSKHYIFRNRIKLRPFYAHLDQHISKRKKNSILFKEFSKCIWIHMPLLDRYKFYINRPPLLLPRWWKREIEVGWREKSKGKDRRVCLRGRIYSIPCHAIAVFASVYLEEKVEFILK